MANTAGVVNQFKVDVLHGYHAFGTCNETRTNGAKDTFKGALILNDATVTPSVATYAALATAGSGGTNAEVSGTGYNAGGEAITNANAPSLDSSTACWTPSASLTWSTVTLSSSFSALYLYNNQFTTKRGVAVYTFGAQTVNAGNFSLTMPTNNQSSALLRIA